MKRHTMRRIHEVLRLKFEQSRNHREISAATGLSKGSVGTYLRRAQDAGIDWVTARELSETELEARLFKGSVGRNVPADRVPVDCEWVHKEMRRKGVTLQLLWIEYRQSALRDPQGRRPYQYSQFCERYREFHGRVDASMRQEHRAGEKVFVDYSGVRPSIVDRETGEVIDVELYVAVLGASNFTFVEATRTQQRDEFIGSTARAYEYFGGVPQITVPDQLRSAVSGPDRLDPEINPVFAEFAQHYRTAVIPARPRKPKDKAKVEVGVQIAQRWILARLRNITFFSLEDLNAAIADLLEELNDRPFQKLEGCRRSVYEQVDRPALQPLPAHRFEPSQWKHVTVHIDHHVEFDARYYSAPHHLIGSKVWARATVNMVELLLDGRRIAAHRRSYGPKGTYVTLDAHRPRSHREWGAWPPQRVIDWATELGVFTGRVVEQIIAAKPHPEQGYRSCLALIRDVKRYSAERVEAACKRALEIGSPTRRSVVAILQNNLEQVAESDEQLPPPVSHENVRGGDYYATEPSTPQPSTPQPSTPQPSTSQQQAEQHNVRRTDLSKNVRDEACRNGGGPTRTPEGGAGQPAQLRGETDPSDRSRVDIPGESPTLSPAQGRKTLCRRVDGGCVDPPGTRSHESDSA